MAKKKQEQKIHVAKPKIGTSYHFRFAGSTLYGPIIKVSENLSTLYGYPHFWFSCKGQNGRTYTYPVSIYAISKNEEDILYV